MLGTAHAPTAAPTRARRSTVAPKRPAGLPEVVGPKGTSATTDSDAFRSEVASEVAARLDTRALPTRAPSPVEAVAVRSDGTAVETSSLAEVVGDDLSAHRPVTVPEGMDATSSWHSAGALQVGGDTIDAEDADLIPEGVTNPHGTGEEAGGTGTDEPEPVEPPAE